MSATQSFGSVTDLIMTFKGGKIDGKTWQRSFNMDKETQAYFKDLLLRRLDDLKLEAEKTVARMTENAENFPDPTDRATVESDRSFMLGIRDRERKHIHKIREALQRIEDGSFGHCEQCGDNIGIERLNARPEATLCIECKRRQEANNRSRGA
jgi:DnaK suppressor protein